MSKTTNSLVGLFVAAGLSSSMSSGALAEDYQLSDHSSTNTSSWFGAYGGVYGSYGGKQSRHVSGETRYVAPDDDSIDQPNIDTDPFTGVSVTNPALRNTLSAPLDRSDLTDLFDLDHNKEVGVILGINIPTPAASRLLLGLEASVGYSIQPRKDLEWTNTQDVTFDEDPGNDGDLLRGTVAESLTMNSDPYDFNGEFVARAGYLVTDNVMLFGLGGVGFRNVTYDLAYDATATFISDDASGNQVLVQDTIGRVNVSDGQMTWIAGLGAEYKLSESLRLRSEYRYSYASGKTYDIEVTPTTINPSVTAAEPSTATLTADDVHNHAFRVSLVVPFNAF